MRICCLNASVCCSMYVACLRVCCMYVAYIWHVGCTHLVSAWMLYLYKCMDAVLVSHAWLHVYSGAALDTPFPGMLNSIVVNGSPVFDCTQDCAEPFFCSIDLSFHRFSSLPRGVTLLSCRERIVLISMGPDLTDYPTDLSFPVLSKAKHKDKTIVVKNGTVLLDGTTWTVKWTKLSNLVSLDGTKKIDAVEDELGGEVLLDDGTAFENPGALAHFHRILVIHLISLLKLKCWELRCFAQLGGNRARGTS